MDPRRSVVGVAWAALSGFATSVVAQERAAQDDRGCRLRVVRAEDGTPIGGAEVFDFAIGKANGG